MEQLIADLWVWVQGILTTAGKDFASVLISIFALIVAAMSFYQKSHEAKGGLRKQLTEVIEKIHDTNVENVKANDEKFRKEYPANYGRLLSDKRRFLVRQAKYIADQIPRFVSPYERGLIAQAFEDIDDVPEAKKWFLEAVKSSPTGFDRLIIHRQYGRFLFRTGQTDLGREQYELALKVLSGDSDRHFLYQGDTYERLAVLEVEYGEPSLAPGLFGKTLGEYNKIRVERVRLQQIQRVDSVCVKLNIDQIDLMSDEERAAREAFARDAM